MIREIQIVKQSVVNLIDGEFVSLSELINIPCWNEKQREILKSLAVIQGCETEDGDFIFDVAELENN